MLPINKVPDILEKNGIASKTDLEKLRIEAECKSLSLEECVLKKRLTTPTVLYKAAAEFFKLPYVSLLGQLVPKDILNLIPESIARSHQIIPYAKTKTTLKIAVLDPEDLQTLDFIEKKTGLTLEVSITNPEGLKDTLKQYKQSLEAEFANINQDDDQSIEKLAKQAPVIRIVDALLEHAIIEDASDIHIESREKDIIVRFRIDGMLQEAMILPHKVHASIVARIKILANLKIDEHNIPQDGRFKVTIPNYRVSIRVSVYPMFGGEKIVMRILHENIKLLNISDLGFGKRQLEIIIKNIRNPNGIILVTGPTGSGKTTTLYAFLASLNKPQVNISTLEDPIEYQMHGINQSQVNPKVGFTFATGLRALLRQDPNIIMVGEIRDSETADIAINAALTGHLVLSTLHTNNAVTSISRLLDLGAPTFLIAQTATLISAQRLLRRICTHCSVPYTLTPEVAKELVSLFDMKLILSTMKREGIITDDQEPVEGMRFFKGKGCSFCGNKGYKGRIAIHELLEVTPEISSLIYSRANSEKLNKAARSQGMVTLVEDAFIKARQGKTTLAEIFRATKE